MRLVCLAALACWSACAQTGEARPEFEVATVKAAVPQPNGLIRVMMGGGPGSDDPGRINYENVNLRMVLTRAYGVKSYQISGPAWLDSERFTITAKIPEGTSKEKFGVMLQNLIADRFKMTVHREKKELPAFAMVVAKSGIRMKESVEDPNLAAAAPAGPAPGPGRASFAMGSDGFPKTAAGGPGRGMRMMMMPGRMKLEGNAMQMSRLAETLEQQLDRAVVDMTELTGKYDFTLIFEPEQGGKMMAGMRMAGPGPGAGAIGGGEGARLPEADTPPNIFTAVQEQLGLKLEARKTSVDVVMIDHMEKAPIEN